MSALTPNTVPICRAVASTDLQRRRKLGMLIGRHNLYSGARRGRPKAYRGV